MIQRKKVNSSKVNLTLSVVFHSLLIAVAFFFAARQGILGKRLKEIAVTMVKEKKPEPPKQKPEEPKPEPAKVAEAPKAAAPETARVAPAAAPPATVSEVSVAAPPAAALPAFEFNDGAKDVQVTTDAGLIYKGLVEHALRTRWNRPEDVADGAFVAEVNVRVDSAGHLAGYDWLKGSGDARWDASVKQVLTQTKAFSRQPPKGFPEKFVVRFDVESAKTEPVFSLSSR